MPVTFTFSIERFVCRVGVVALALLVSVPFIQPWHTTPIPSFYSEWWAVVFGSMVCLALMAARSLPLPGITLLALILALISWLQLAFGYAAIPQLAGLYWNYLLWAALLASASRLLVDRFGVPVLFHILAYAILIGAVLVALLGLFHPWLYSLGWPGLSLRHGGPVGQLNHLTSYVWLGLASGLYLYAAGNLPRLIYWAAATLLTFTVALAGQRSSFLYAIALIGIALIVARRCRSPQFLEARRLAIGIAALFVLAQPVVMFMPSSEATGAVPPPALRMAQEAKGPSIRMQLLSVGLEGIATAPLLGNGIGSYPSLALTHADKIPADQNPGSAESAHNILVDIAVEFGLPAALFVLFSALAWLWRMSKLEGSIERSWACSVFLILGLHALIEYPLSYSYFLGLLAVVSGIFGGAWFVCRRLTLATLTIVLIVWGSFAIAEQRRDYRLLEMALALGNQPVALSHAREALLRIPAESLLSPWVNTIACVSLDPLHVPIHDGISVCNVALRFAPTVDAGINAVVLTWRSGNADNARSQLRQLRLATQSERDRVDVRLSELISKDEHLSSLLQTITAQ